MHIKDIMAGFFCWPFFMFLLKLQPAQAANPCLNTFKRFEYKQYHMGTEFNLIFYHSDSAVAHRLAEECFGMVKRLDSIFSDYKENSELNKLSASAGSGRFIKVSDEMWNILKYAKKISATTDGAFDITVGPVVKLWRRARRQGKMPPMEKIEDAKKKIGYKNITFLNAQKMVRLNIPDMQLDLGGIAKGYTADAVVKYMNDNCVKSVLVDAGGDVTLGDAPPCTNGWKIAIDVPGDTTKKYILMLQNKAIATSGDLYQHVIIEGKRYSHIVNPKTGLGLEDESKVTVIAKNGIVADAMASAVSVAGPKSGLKFIKKFKKAEVLFVRTKEGTNSVYCSKGMKKYLKKAKIE